MSDQKGIIFTKKNYQLLIIALGIILIGFLLMAIGEVTDANIFGFRRITLATIILIIGYVLVAYSILKSFKKEK